MTDVRITAGPTSQTRIDQVLAIGARLGESAEGQSWSPAVLEDWLNRHSLALAMEGQIAIGFIVYQTLSLGLYEILALGLLPEYQRQGRMTQLLRAVFEATVASEWWLEAHEANLRAIALYLKLGFTEVGRRPRYYPDGGSAVLYRRGVVGPNRLP